MKFLTEGLMHLTTGLETAKFARRIADTQASGANQEKAFSKTCGFGGYNWLIVYIDANCFSRILQS